MPYVEIISRDNEFEIRPMSDASADSREMQGGETIYIENDVYDAWVAHMKQHAVFKALWIQLQNDLRRREARNRGEVLP
jgi:hypothetical protein